MKMETVIVEREFDQEVTPEMLEVLAADSKFCLETHNVTWKASFLSRDRRSMICIYEAPDAESVRAAQRMARFPTRRVYMADDWTPPGFA